MNWTNRIRFILPGLLLPLWILSCSVSRNGADPSKTPDDWQKKFSVVSFDRLPENRGLLADHYPSSNERRIDLFRDQIRDLKGGYVGVGTDQNFTFIGWANSRYAWLMDFDPVVVAVNRIHFTFLEKAVDYNQFKELWSRKNRASSWEFIKKKFEKDPDFERIQTAWKVAHRGWNDVPERLEELALMEKRFHLGSFSSDPEQYRRIRQMVLDGRIQAIPGDLNGSVSFQNIARSAESLGVPIRVLYTSNAEEYFNFPESYRKNILALPFDDKSVVIRTMTSGTRQFLGYPEGEKFPENYPFHYNVQPMSVFRKWMTVPQKYRVVEMLRHTHQIQKGLSRMEAGPLESGYPEPDASRNDRTAGGGAGAK